jgi:hypothetical protein
MLYKKEKYVYPFFGVFSPPLRGLAPQGPAAKAVIASILELITFINDEHNMFTCYILLR